MRRLALLLVLSLSAGAVRLQAQAFDLTGVGARARSMGSAFTGLADDYSAIYWNPAALADLPKREVAFNYEDRYSLGLVGVSYLALAYPGIGPGGVGISWNRLATTHQVQDLDYSENTYTFAYGMPVIGGWSLGTSLNFYRLLSQEEASGYGLNFSLHFNLNRMFAAGLEWQNAAATTLRYEGGAEDALPKDLRLGVALKPTQWLKGTLDVDNIAPNKPKVHVGAEVTSPQKTLAVRGGFSQKTAPSGFNWVYTAGGSVTLGSIVLDYSFENHFDLGMTHLFSVTVLF